MFANNEEKTSLPLGLKIIWFLQIFSFTTSIFVVFNKANVIIIGPWVLPSILSNLYISTILVSQGYIIYGMPKFQYRAWILFVLIHLAGICLLFSHLYITQELFTKFINLSSKEDFTLSTYKTFIIPAMLLQSIILLYIAKKRSIFTQ